MIRGIEGAADMNDKGEQGAADKNDKESKQQV